MSWAKQVLNTSSNSEWPTPKKVFDDLNNEFYFNLDPCATDENHKCDLYFTKEQDGLQQDWSGYRVFCNPPYGREVGKWVKKASESNCPIVVMLLVARTDTRWFHEYIYGKSEIRFIKGRLHYGDGNGRAPWGSMIVIFRKGETE